MNPKIEYDKVTDVAYIDLCETPASEVRIDIVDISEALGFKTPILARIDENEVFLGLIIEDFRTFKWEVRKKYLALKVDQFIELIVSRARELTRTMDCKNNRHLLAHV